MTQGSKTAAEQIRAFVDAAQRTADTFGKASPMGPISASITRMRLANEARDALADWLMQRDWPSTVRQPGSRRYEYRKMAAAILNGEAWAIRKAWPEAAYDIQTRRLSTGDDGRPGYEASNAQTTPDLIPEPGLFGVVEAETLLDPFRSTFFNTAGGWRAARDGVKIQWCDLVDPVVIREGI